MELLNSVDIIFTSHIANDNRARLFQQTVNSFFSHTNFSYVASVTFIDDCSPIQIGLDDQSGNMKLIRNETQKGAGWSRNLGIAQGKAEILYLSDTDVFFTPLWLEKMLAGFEEIQKSDLKIGILAGGTHRYSGTNKVINSGGFTFNEKWAVSTWSWMFLRDTYNKIGKIMDNAVGPAASEDVEFCERLYKAGYSVAGLIPETIFHCGITSMNGDFSPGYETFPKVPNFPKVLFL